MSSAPEPAESSAAPADSVFEAVPAILRGALIRRGFSQLTAVQAAVLAASDAERDLQISSQTGSGKTVALGFVMAPRLIAAGGADVKASSGPSALIIVPTRELAVQVREELGWLFADLPGVKLDCVTGGTHVGAEQNRLRRAPTVLVGTPGRLLDHIRSGALDVTAVTQVVLDEADQMLDLGFRDDLETILGAMPEDRRTHLISATFPIEVRQLTRKFQRDARQIQGTALGAANADIEHICHLVDTKDRYAALVNMLLLAGEERTLVFVRTRAATAELADKLTQDGFAAQPISGELSQVLRTRTLEAFRRGTITTLIATDVAARGLDIPDVTLVVHADPPMDSAVYTHRSGRTGRAGQKGRSVALVLKGAERRVRRILMEEKITAKWLPVPDAATVRACQRERAELRLRTALTEQTPTAEQRALAAKLLAEYRPEDLVAGLLTSLSSHEPRSPFEIGTPPVRERAMAPVMSSEPAPVSRSASPSAATSDSASEMPVTANGDRVRFRINWGTVQGAVPKRILAHICRRGDIRSSEVGAIDLQPFSSTFEVAAHVAESFARRVKPRDSRDPHLVIEPAGHSAERRFVPAARGMLRKPWQKRERFARGDR
jgi:ATP-dependent RNA helicase DeaD